ncbi:hypothetical protein GS426_12000 [Rhodococcus hoagii]|nr:hypothetical protein [Prescottella equi]
MGAGDGGEPTVHVGSEPEPVEPRRGAYVPTAAAGRWGRSRTSGSPSRVRAQYSSCLDSTLSGSSVPPSTFCCHSA